MRPVSNIVGGEGSGWLGGFAKEKLVAMVTGCFGCGILWAGAQLAYVTNLDTALAYASNHSCRVVVYTGNALLCSGKSPREYFDSIVQWYPRFTARSNAYVVCEQFTFLPIKAPSGGLNPAAFPEQDRVKPLYDRYFIPTFYPTLTFVNPSGRRLNGPFWTLGGTNFIGNIDNYYETLGEYLAAEDPLNRDKGRTNLLNAVFSADAARPIFGLFRCLRHTNGGPQELLLENGSSSRNYEPGEPFQFTVRDLEEEVRSGPPWGEHQYGTLVLAAGNFKNDEPFTGPFLARLNGAWFRGTMNDSSRTLARGLTGGRLKLRMGEYHFAINVMDQSVASALMKQLEGLR